MGVEWIEYNNKKILYVNYSTCKESSQMISILHEYTNILKESRERVPCLEDYEGAYVSREFMDEGNKLGKEVHAHKIGKNALLGVKGIKKVCSMPISLLAGKKM